MQANEIQHRITIPGVVTPAIIHNGSYFFINLPVYQNGLIDCWETLDLALFQEKLANGWVTTSVPEGKQLSIHGLGSFEINNGHWEINADALYQRVKDLIRGMNPEEQNLYNCHGVTTKKIGNVNVSLLGTSEKTPTRPERPESSFSKLLQGESLSVFYREESAIYLADLRVFPNELIELGRVPNPRALTLAELEQAARDGVILTEPPPKSRITIHQLGAFDLGASGWSTTISDLLLEVRDLIETTNKRPDSIDKCRAIYKEYVAAPSNALKEKLKAAYESIPEHNRMYVGDMDTKDTAIRMIIYGDDEIESWSHRAVARAKKMTPLPNIVVPKPELSEHAKMNRAFWDSYSDSYQQAHGEQLSTKEPGWGVWQLKESALNVLGDVSKRDVLELGCGAAQWSIALASRGARVVGLDNSAQQLEHAKRLTPEGAAVRLIHASAEDVPLPDKSFDIIFCDHGAMSFADPYKTVPEVARLLRPGGLFAFSMATPIFHTALDPITDKIEEHLSQDYFSLRRFESEGAVDFQLPYGEWVRLFVKNGLIIEDLIELQPGKDATTTYTHYVTLDWARRWPAEHIWKLRRR